MWHRSDQPPQYYEGRSTVISRQKQNIWHVAGLRRLKPSSVHTQSFSSQPKQEVNPVEAAMDNLCMKLFINKSYRLHQASGKRKTDGNSTPSHDYFTMHF